MEEIKDAKLIKCIDNPMTKLLSNLMYSFRFDKETQSIYVQDNHCMVLGKEDVEVLIKGLQNSLTNFPEEEFNKWNKEKAYDLGNCEPPRKKVKIRSNYVKPIKNGYVYFIKDGLGFIKIGLTKDIRSRLKTIQTGNCNVELIHHIYSKDMVKTEALFHELFADKRVNGEWFKLTKKDITFIKSRKLNRKILSSIKGNTHE